ERDRTGRVRRHGPLRSPSFDLRRLDQLTGKPSLSDAGITGDDDTAATRDPLARKRELVGPTDQRPAIEGHWPQGRPEPAHKRLSSEPSLQRPPAHCTW